MKIRSPITTPQSIDTIHHHPTHPTTAKILLAAPNSLARSSFPSSNQHINKSSPLA
ncbi:MULTISPECIES: hypothetical protein [unclassified Microcoleus]|uniref:hypothetical protein n=1 Tax=unclassified Microcoleus TaxID=2642155 RepID=UPI002FD5044E